MALIIQMMIRKSIGKDLMSKKLWLRNLKKFRAKRYRKAKLLFRSFTHQELILNFSKS